MFLLLFSSIIAIILPPIFLIIAYILRFKTIKDQEKSSSFECGFDPKNKARIPFSTRFFLLAVIFLVFDIEIILLIPSPIALSNHLFLPTLIRTMLFLLILMAGLLHE